MASIELKSNIHAIIDRIQSEQEQLLQTIYDFLSAREKNEPGELWNSLTEEQKQEILPAYEESEIENNLIDREQAFRRTKWKSPLKNYRSIKRNIAER